MLLSVFATPEGHAFEDEGYIALARTGTKIVEVGAHEFIPLPAGASLAVMPQRLPVGLNRLKGVFEVIQNKGHAVAALLPQGYTRTFLPAYIKEKNSQQLPLFGYAALAWHSEEERFYVAAIATDDERGQWDPAHFSTSDLPKLIANKKADLPGNRIIAQLAHCALHYGCFTAQNVFYERWEGAVPVSAHCNARCIGCISEQASDCCPSPQGRITYTPTVGEVVDVLTSHLHKSPAGIASFGQGCEGEPLLQAQRISQAIAEVRSQYTRGTINANTNAGYTQGLQQVCEAGIDALRVSMISAIPEHYHAYVRPQGYGITDVRNSLAIAQRNQVYTSLNWLTLPGVTDTVAEVEALVDLIRTTGVQMVQLRNLNIDPDIYPQIWSPPFEEEALGIDTLLTILQEEVPDVKVGSFSHAHKGADGKA